MYYTLRSVPHNATRITTYEVLSRGKIVYKIAYKGTEKSAQVGRFSRYALYTIPRSLPYGKYIYRAILTIGSGSQSASWIFHIGRSTRAAATHRR